jgi:hypothetical protein
MDRHGAGHASPRARNLGFDGAGVCRARVQEPQSLAERVAATRRSADYRPLAKREGGFQDAFFAPCDGRHSDISNSLCTRARRSGDGFSPRRYSHRVGR